MAYLIQLPKSDGSASGRAYLDIVDGTSTAVQRLLRRHGLAGFEAPTMAALLTLWAQHGRELVFFDVGANIGLYAAVCASLFDPRAVVAVEPTPGTAELARQVMQVNRLSVRVEQVAFGAEAGEAPLYLSVKSDSSNSLLEGFKRSTGSVRVRVDTLDAYVERSGLVPDVVKIDVEGLEPAVIAGARRTLEHHRPYVVVEALHRRGHDHGDDVTDAMAGLEYHFYALDASHAWQPQPCVRGRGTPHEQNWLLTPEPVDSEFATRNRRWAMELSGCTADRNSPPLTRRELARSVYEREGLHGLVRGMRNQLRQMVRR